MDIDDVFEKFGEKWETKPHNHIMLSDNEEDTARIVWKKEFGDMNDRYGGSDVAYVLPPKFQEDENDDGSDVAQLIAAAPQLLLACMNMKQWLDSAYSSGHFRKNIEYDQLCEAIHAATKPIPKIEK